MEPEERRSAIGLQLEARGGEARLTVGEARSRWIKRGEMVAELDAMRAELGARLWTRDEAPRLVAVGSSPMRRPLALTALTLALIALTAVVVDAGRYDVATALSGQVALAAGWTVEALLR